MTKLSDTQRILLSTASQRENGSLLPLPTCLKPGGGTAKALAALTMRGLAEERETTDSAAAHRSDGDARYGVFLTPAGAAAIGVEPGTDGTVEEPATQPASPALLAPKRSSKSAAVLALLTRAEGATLPELIEATAWLPHTTRAALTGLRKKGHAIERTKRDGVTCYRVVEVG